jgi:uncharacterized protein YicC (UPF0701 family)
MTGFAQVKGESSADGQSDLRPVVQSNGRMAFALSLKSVNHRFLDLHFRLPSGTDSLEMQLRRLLKEKMARGHVEVSLSLERGGSESVLAQPRDHRRYIAAFRAAAPSFLLLPSPISTPSCAFPARSIPPTAVPTVRLNPQ